MQHNNFKCGITKEDFCMEPKKKEDLRVKKTKEAIRNAFKAMICNGMSSVVKGK